MGLLILIKKKYICLTIVYTPPPPPFLLGGLNHQPNFQKGGGFTGPQLLEGSCWESDLFSGGLQFSQQKIN